MVTLAVPYDFFSLVFASIVLVCAFYAVGYVYRRRSQAANGPRSALSAKMTETPAPLGITVGRWR